MYVRPAIPDDLADVLNVLDGAALSTDADLVRESIAEELTLVAVSEDGERVLGAITLDGDRIDAVAVRRRRRGQGIGTALVEAAAARRDHLVAECDAGVRPFYESLGFDLQPLSAAERRWRGRRERE